MIGVIAALTLPTLMNSTNDKEIVARVKKAHAILNEALSRAVAKYGPVDTWILSTDTTDELKSQRFGKRLTEFMQVEKICGLESGKGCFANSNSQNFINVKGSNYDSLTNEYKVILSDGMSLSIDGYESNPFVAYITVDIDGPQKGKNFDGIDLFGFDILKNNRVSAASDFPKDRDLGRDGCLDGAVATCTAWILKYDNADYIHCEVTDANPTCN